MRGRHKEAPRDLGTSQIAVKILGRHREVPRDCLGIGVLLYEGYICRYLCFEETGWNAVD